MASCFICPILLIGTFLVKTYINGYTISCCAISTGIAYYEKTKTVHAISVVLTIISCLFGFFVGICRQIQVEVIFRDYIEENRCTDTSAKRYYIVNLVGVFFNIITFILIPLFVIFDSARYNIHSPFAVTAMFTAAVFLALTMTTLFKQRDIQFKKNKEQSGMDGWTAFKKAGFEDALMMLVLLICAVVGTPMYLAAFYTTPNRLDDGVEVDPYGNIAEWVAFIALILGIMVLALTFHRDRVDDELIAFWRRLSSCCNCCGK